MSATTVVIATRDRAPDLLHTLARLSELAVPVVVVDNGSSDDTVSRVRRDFPSVDVLELGRNEGAVARNYGVALARTPYVAFSDDDSWWAPDALERAEALFAAHPRLGLLAARTLVEPAGVPDPVCARMAASPLGRDDDLPGPSVLGFVCCGAVVRREAFQRAGGFSPVLFFRGEERLLSWDLAAAGWTCCYVDEVVAHHRPSTTRPPTHRQRRRELRNDLLTTWLRRPARVVAGEALTLLRRAPRDRDALVALLAALARLPAVLRDRRPLPPEVERRVEVLAAG